MPKRFVFIVQGEGRGHMTQAMALYEIITGQGHEVSKVFVGTSKRRSVPSFFFDKIECPIELVSSPNFVLDKDNKSIRVFPSLYKNLLSFRKYLRSIRKISSSVKSLKPDAVINFYDLLGGLAALFSGHNVPFHAVAHQYLAYHRDFPFPSNSPSHRRLFMFHNKLTLFRSQKVFCLSFQEYSDFDNRNFKVAPPLLRQEITCLHPTVQDHILAYVVNDGYADEILRWYSNQKEVKSLDCFWDKRGVPNPYEPVPGIRFHQLNDHKFLSLMASSRGYVSTAGFESICEAIFLGKPTLVVPVKKQYEQKCNALDAEKTGVVLKSSKFDLDELLKLIKSPKTHPPNAKNWMQRMYKFYCEELDLDS